MPMADAELRAWRTANGRLTPDPDGDDNDVGLDRAAPEPLGWAVACVDADGALAGFSRMEWRTERAEALAELERERRARRPGSPLTPIFAVLYPATTQEPTP